MSDPWPVGLLFKDNLIVPISILTKVSLIIRFSTFLFRFSNHVILFTPVILGRLGLTKLTSKINYNLGKSRLICQLMIFYEPNRIIYYGILYNTLSQVLCRALWHSLTRIRLVIRRLRGRPPRVGHILSSAIFFS